MTAFFFLGAGIFASPFTDESKWNISYVYALSSVNLTWITREKIPISFKMKKDFLKYASSFIPSYISDFDAYYFWGFNDMGDTEY